MPNYTNQANIEGFLGRSLTASEVTFLAILLPAIDKWINRKLESNFASVGATTRYYDGGGHSIDIDPAQTITAVGSLNNDGSASYDYINLTEYVLEPVNDDVKREIVYRGRNRRFPSGQRRMAVTALFTEYDFANSKVPDDIVLAATRMAAGVINAGKIAGLGGNVQQESLEGHEIRYDVTNNALQTLTDGDPILEGMLAERREIFLYYGSDNADSNDSW